MLFHKTPLLGLYVIEMEPDHDMRGYFSRSIDKNKFQEHGLNANFVQESFSYNKKKGTIRGLHFQLPPEEENKLIRVTQGSIFDVVVDLRKHSPTFCQWYSIELSHINCKMLYIPKGFAHGFQSLEDHTEVLYAMTTYYVPSLYRGVRYNDPAFGIQWPIHDEITINERDRTYANFDPGMGL